MLNLNPLSEIFNSEKKFAISTYWEIQGDNGFFWNAEQLQKIYSVNCDYADETKK